MYRKSLVAALMLLYSASAIGIPMHFHYCQGELKHVSFLLRMECHDQESGNPDHACCQAARSNCTSGQTLNSCCDDATQWIQDDLPAICAKSDLDLKADLFTTPLLAGFPGQVRLSTEAVTDLINRPVARPLYLMQCSLIFYG